MYRIRTTPFATHPKAGSPENSTPELTQVLSSGIARVEALARAGFTSERLGLPERAIGLYQKALAELPPYTPPSRWELAVPVKYNLALLLSARGRACEAVLQIEECLSLISAENSAAANEIRAQLDETLATLSTLYCKA